MRTGLLLFALCYPITLLSGREAEVAKPNAKEDFLAVVEAHFGAWDVDRDGTLSKAEIDALVADGRIKGDEAGAVAALKRASRSKKEELPPLTKNAIVDLASSPPKKDAPNLPVMFSGGSKRIAAVKRVLFASGKPRLETVHQGHLGNCFSLAPLGAIAAGRPDYIVKEMIRELPDGRYQVKLGKETFQVSAPTDAELAMTASTESDGIWVNVYEKAAAQARYEMKSDDEREGASALDVLSRGGSAGTMLAYITGHDMVRFSCKFARDPKTTPEEFEKKLVELRAALTSAVKEHRLMTCGTTATKIPGMTPNHAYAVLGYDESKDLVRCWNPHGDTTTVKGDASPATGYPLKDGVFEMPLPVFVKEFAGLAFELLPK